MPRIALLSLLLAVTPVWGGAQSVYGTLVGTVTDPSGAVVPGVTIRVVNLETGIWVMIIF
jgi:hypothetical protein